MRFPPRRSGPVESESSCQEGRQCAGQAGCWGRHFVVGPGPLGANGKAVTSHNAHVRRGLQPMRGRSAVARLRSRTNRFLHHSRPVGALHLSSFRFILPLPAFADRLDRVEPPRTALQSQAGRRKRTQRPACRGQDAEPGRRVVARGGAAPAPASLGSPSM